MNKQERRRVLILSMEVIRQPNRHRMRLIVPFQAGAYPQHGIKDVTKAECGMLIIVFHRERDRSVIG